MLTKFNRLAAFAQADLRKTGRLRRPSRMRRKSCNCCIKSKQQATRICVNFSTVLNFSASAVNNQEIVFNMTRTVRTIISSMTPSIRSSDTQKAAIDNLR